MPISRHIILSSTFSTHRFRDFHVAHSISPALVRRAVLLRTRPTSMAGADQKSFLGTLSPWSTPRSTTPQLSDRPRGNPDVLQRSQGEDHTVTHRYKLSLRHYPSDCPPLKARWFYAVDSPKRKPALLDQKKSDSKPPPPPKKFIPFSSHDSQSIEATFQKLSDIEDSHIDEKALKAALEQVSTKVPVNEDYLFDVDVEARELSPAYWIGPVYEVRRGTWFFQEGSVIKPCEENLATQLEEGYVKLRPWRIDTEEGGKSPDSASAEDYSPAKVGAGSMHIPLDTSRATKPREKTQSGGNGPLAPASEPQQYRLFGAYMNKVVAYQDASTAWLTTDDFMSRMSTTVYQTLGRASGTRVIRGLGETRRPREPLDARGSEKLGEKGPKAARPETMPASNTVPASGPNPADASGSEIGAEAIARRPISTLERQMSSLAGEPQNPAELEEQARKQEEQEMEDSRETDEDQEREVDHLVLVTHGIGQRLGLRLESINFIHDVNMLRKTFKGVYKASPDLQALNSAFPDSTSNCRVQVLPICWRHLLDFPYRGVRQNRKELDLTDADILEDDAYPSLADITLESVPAVRNLISDLAMDVLLYQSGYCEHIANIVKQECNRILQLYKTRNPSFNGTVSLCGHSLGSAILFDILCNQPSNVGVAKRGKATAQDTGDLGDQQGEMQSALNFDCEEFFCLGSPIALFQMLKGKTIAGHSHLGLRGRKSALDVGDFDSQRLGSVRSSKQDSRGNRSRDLIENTGIISTPKCRDLYNIFHPSDPVSYRIEPLISPAMASLKPQPLPSVKKSLWTTSGQSLSILGTRMGQSVGSLWSNFTSGVASSLLNRSLGLSAEEASTPRGTGSIRSSDDSAGHERTQSSTSQHTSLHDSDDRHETLIDHDLETLYDGFQKDRTTHKKDPTRSSGQTEPGLDSEDQERKLKFEDAKVRALNSNGRVDYSIQEGAFDISLIASIASHLTYWGDEDVNHFMLSQMLSRTARHRVKGVDTPKS